MRAVILLSLAGAALAYKGGDVAKVSKTTTVSKRSLDPVTITGFGLCGSSNSQEIPAQGVCTRPAALVLSEIDWQPCCSFSSGTSEACRTYTVGNSYCMSAVPECLADQSTSGMATCDTLTANDKMTISMSFDVEMDNTDCCKSCTCFGDPECQSFKGVDDLWIPCDGRKNGKDCKMYKDICELLDGPNNKKCVWNTKKKNSAGTNFPQDGSPCVSNLEPNEQTLMHMINVDKSDAGGAVEVELSLGERGVIQTMRVNFGKAKLAGTLDAEKCFSPGGAAAWGLQDGDLPADWVETRIDNELVSWWIKDAASSTLVRAVCLRSVERNSPGLARINVQEVAVAPEKEGTGFCFTDSISEKTGDFEHSSFIHQSCTQNETTALQGCKYLVEMGTPLGMLPWCGESYCNTADIANPAACLSKMVKNYDNAKVWMDYYCEAVWNNPKSEATRPTSVNDCKNTVKKEGWPTAEALYGKGLKDAVNPSGDGECGDSIGKYKVTNPDDAQCEQGVAIQTLNKVTDQWETAYFVPVSYPFCEGSMEIGADEAIDLFSNEVRLQQCDAKMNDARCAAVSTCAPSYGVKFQMSYSSPTSDIATLFDKGMLQCVPHSVTGSTTWCFADMPDYTPLSEVCPCPDRRALGAGLFLGN